MKSSSNLSLMKNRDDSSFEDDAMLNDDDFDNSNHSKLIRIIIIATIAIVVVVIVIVLAVVLTKKKKKKDENPETPQVTQTPEPPQTQPPPIESPNAKEITFSGINDISIVQGKYFNSLSGVTATRENGKDLSSKISVTGDLNTAKEGTYTLKYHVFDEDDQLGSDAQRTIRVTKNPKIGLPKPVPKFSLPDESLFNVAKGCKVIASSGQDASNVADENIKTRWESAHGVDDVYITVDLGDKVPVKKVNIFWEAAYAKEYQLMISDDSVNWEVIEDVTNENEMKSETIDGQTVYPNRFSFDDEKIEARFVRMKGIKRIGNYGYSIFEFEVIGPLGTVAPLESYPDLFDARNDRSPDFAREQKEWIQIDLGDVKDVTTIRLAFQNYLFPYEYTVSHSRDGQTYEKAELRNMPYSGDTFNFVEVLQAREETKKITVSARYFKIEMNSLRFFASAYRIVGISFKKDEEAIQISSISASSSRKDHDISLVKDGDDSTYWENDNNVEYQTIDLKEIKNVGRVDLYWRGDDGGKGKYYDLEVSSDGSTWKKIFRQVHGATPMQNVYVYERCRYIRVIDFQSPGPYQFMLEGAVVHSQYPETSLEGKVNYDVNLKFPERTVINDGSGSYVTGGTDFPASRLIAYLDDSLRGKPVPSNGWWQGILVHDKGYNMFMNPLTMTFGDSGLWITNPGAGYFDGLVPGTGSQTVNNDVHDICIGYDGVDVNAKVRVTGYSDFGVSAVMSDEPEIDKLTVFLSQGSLYAFFFFAEPEKALITASVIVSVFDLEGKEILKTKGDEFTSDSIVVLVRTHSTYKDGVNKHYETDGSGNKNVVENEKIYEERYYVVSVPENTLFARSDSGIRAVMKNGNYMSVGAASEKIQVKEDGTKIDSSLNVQFPKEEVNLLHQHGYAFVVDTSCTYSFDAVTNKVKTEFNMKTLLVRNGFSSEAHAAYLPHQLEHSDYKGGYVYPSVRGNCRSFTGNLFMTIDQFHGIIPTFPEPTDSTYKTSSLNDLLNVIYNHNGGDKTPEESNLISGDPYWQGKNLHPMSMAVIAADQIGAVDMRDKFLDKIEYILTDWFTYDESKDAKTGAYFYYDKEWGTLYYKNSEFGAGVNLADHYFTYGYYLLAAGILSCYRHSFAEKWGNMIELLIRDYMNPSHDDNMFPYMRNFDCFAGHGWAGGYADNNGGNNQESAGEALNSWVGAYFYSMATGNEIIQKTAIYGYTTELSAVKHYWYNYFGDFLKSYPYGGTGQVYGSSNFYGTFFNGEPLYVYGIHLIPGQEYLTSFGLSDYERTKLSEMIEKMRYEQSIWDVPEESKNIHAWQHIFIPIEAIYDADKAIDWYDECLRTMGNIGNDQEQFNVYYLMHGMKSNGVRTTDIWAENGLTATVYVKDNLYNAICWNPTEENLRFVFRNKDGIQCGFALIPPKSLVSVDPTKEKTTSLGYFDVSDFSLSNYFSIENANLGSGNDIVFSAEGSVTYHLTFGSSEVYRRAELKGVFANDVCLFIDNNEVKLSQTSDGYKSEPFMATFKHSVTITASQTTVNHFTFEKLTLVKSDVKMSATSDSVNGNENTADKAVDGNIETRWESKHEEGPINLLIALEVPTTVYQLQIHWEAASAKEYKVYFSADGTNWKEVYNGMSNQGRRIDVITPSVVMEVNHIKIECISRTTNYGYSIYEVEVFSF